MSNPLINPPAFPQFDQIKPEHAEAIHQIIKENREKLAELLKQSEFTWENLIHPMEIMANRLAKAFSPISHLHAVISTDEWRQAHEKVLPELSAYESDLSQHLPLYEAMRKIKEGPQYKELPKHKQKYIDDSILDFELNGVNLPACEKENYKANSLKLAELGTKFSNQLLDSTNAWTLHLADDSRLKGLPDSAKALLAAQAKEKGKEGYLITLDAPSVTPILSYCEDRELRREVHRAYAVRASELSDGGKWDNRPVIREMMQLRQRQMNILGLVDFASGQVIQRMTGKPAVVFDFLNDLVAKTNERGREEMTQLAAYAKERLGIEKLEAHDVGYASERLSQEKYAISQEQLRPYFPISKVLDGLFKLAQKLFAVEFRPTDKLPVWHKDVRAFDVLENGELMAHFYLDLYARSQKRGGAWMDSAVSRFGDGEPLQLPVAYLVCNFTPAVGGKEACLNHDEILTLLHEFGHGLHHMLTKIDVYGQSGINGVEWDAVEQPSQFMENFGYDKEILSWFSGHIDSGEKLPAELHDKLLAAKNFQSAMAMLRQLEFALFDFSYHSGANFQRDPMDVLKETQKQVTVVPVSDYSRFPMQFSHIFGGGYAAGYYSYKWAEVLSADSFSAFEEEGLLNEATGRRFRDEILAVGSSRPSMDSFVAFRGRKPEVKALLRHNGLGD